MRRIRIEHSTTYNYSSPVTFGKHRLLLRPREGHDIRVRSSTLNINPVPHEIHWHRDAQSNSVASVAFSSGGQQLRFDSEVIVEHYEDDQPMSELSIDALTYPFQYDANERAELAPYMQPVFSRAEDEIKVWRKQFWVGGQAPLTVDLLGHLNKTIHHEIEYRAREAVGVQRPYETLSLLTGSCRDLATLFVESCRHLGLAARFVSGYLYAPDLPVAAAATHAWAEVYLPGAGWCGFDSTTGQTVGADHISVAVARHPETVPPIEGSFFGNAESEMIVSVKLSL